MTTAIRFSGPADYGERTIIPLIRDSTLVSDHGCMVARDPVGLVIMEHGHAWFVSLSEEVTMTVIDELLGITE
ncbi:MAG TPA: hypothetical protein VMS89_05095 [Methanoregulaceae archaeon]|nr:hypothetical protein [Methanoregulaceae archaeon]